MHDFLDRLFHNLNAVGIDLTGLEIDHIAYRATTIEEADGLKVEWQTFSTLVNSAQVNGREVSIFACDDAPVTYGSWSISTLELLYPRPERSYGGWDHIEVVIGSYSDSIETVRQ